MLAYLGERSGSEFDPGLVTTFNRMMLDGAAQVRVLREAVSGGGAARPAETTAMPAPADAVPA